MDKKTKAKVTFGIGLILFFLGIVGFLLGQDSLRIMSVIAFAIGAVIILLK